MSLRGDNSFFRFCRPLCIVFLLFAASVASASPTVTSQDIILSASLSPADSPTAIPSTISNVIEPVNTELANLGREFLQPPASSAGLSNTRSNLVKPLPAVPAAILMALMGFLCVSLVKDRRVWLTALAGVLWVGQAGIHAVPELAMHLGHRNHINRQTHTGLTYIHCLENSSRLRSDIEGTRYIGLLHRLAGIPDRPMSSLQPRLSFLQPRLSFLQPRLSFLRKQESRAASHSTGHLTVEPRITKKAPQSAFLSEQYSLNSLFNCLASKAEPFICFSPAFIFAHLARGPPKLA